MQKIGFSTGALAYGDFHRGIALQSIGGVDAIELSALREDELDALMEALPALDLQQFSYRSFHAPSGLKLLSGRQLAEKLEPIAAIGLPLIIHPDIIENDFGPWKRLGKSVLLENMDTRKPICRTAREMHSFFEMLPDAGFCFDIGHARQVDPTMAVAFEFLTVFRSKLAEIHISEVDWHCKHRKIGTAAALSFHESAQWIPEGVPVIIESVVAPHEIEKELQTVRRCLDAKNSYFRKDNRAASVA